MLNARDAATAGEILLLDEGVRLRVLQQLAEQGMSRLPAPFRPVPSPSQWTT